MEKVLIESKQLWKAIQEGDIAYLKEHVHFDAMFVHMGVTLQRDAELQVIQERGIVYKDIEFEEVTCKKMEATMVVLSKLKLTAIVGGNEVCNPFVVTEIYTNNKDDYKLACMSFTKIIY